ncbi:hypothetical protein [Mesorhizobium sp. NPDC059025]|uniref:hypothetical protein n=1 Tax=unclassified Mesorhizobium TaxID=325217 RepID=UPI00367E1174
MMWLTLTQHDGQMIAINFDNVKLLLPTEEGTDISFTDGTGSYVRETFRDVTKRLENLRNFARGA